MSKNTTERDYQKEAQRCMSRADSLAKRHSQLTRQSRKADRRLKYHSRSVTPRKVVKNPRRLDFLKPSCEGPIKVPSIEGVQTDGEQRILCVLSSQSLEPIGGEKADKRLYQVQCKKQLVKDLTS